MTSCCLACFLALVQGPFFNIVPLRVEPQYPFMRDSVNVDDWMPWFSFLDLGIMDPRTRLGIGISLGEDYQCLTPGGIGIGSWLPIHVYWSPLLRPHSVGPVQTASMLMLSASFNMWGLDVGQEAAARRYADLNVSYQPGPMIALRAGYVTARSKLKSGSTVYGGLELKLGGWFRRHQRVTGRPTDMRVRDVDRFLRRLEKKIEFEYLDDRRFTPVRSCIDSFRVNVLPSLRRRELRTMLIATVIPPSVHVGTCLWALYGNPREGGGDGEAQCFFLVSLPMSACCLTPTGGYGAIVGYLYGNTHLSDGDVEAVESIIRSYNEATYEFPAEQDSISLPR